jgi:hypothetical protein
VTRTTPNAGPVLEVRSVPGLAERDGKVELWPLGRRIVLVSRVLAAVLDKTNSGETRRDSR